MGKEPLNKKLLEYVSRSPLKNRVYRDKLKQKHSLNNTQSN